jgi:hypothetical protein
LEKNGKKIPMWREQKNPAGSKKTGTVGMFPGFFKTLEKNAHCFVQISGTNKKRDELPVTRAISGTQ